MKHIEIHKGEKCNIQQKRSCNIQNGHFSL
jgi:hypothetical protein